jgi:hypothetical protein
MSSNQLEQQHLSSSIASPQVQFKIESDSTDKCMGEELMDAAVSAAVAHAAESIYIYLPGKLAGSKSRQAHTLKDPDGTEKIFNSALGFLARKFIHVLFASPTCSVDMNAAALQLEVPKRRIYDVTNVLEGVGLIEKRSKNTVAWKGSELLLGSSFSSAAKQRINEIRDEISDLHSQEASLDQWMVQLQKLPLSGEGQMVSTCDIVKALLYPVGSQSGKELKDELVDESGKPQQAVLAVHAPFDSIAHLPVHNIGSPQRQLYVGTKPGFLKHGFGAGTTVDLKRKGMISLKSRKGIKVPRIDDRVTVYLMPCYFDNKDKKVKSLGARQLSDDPYISAAAAAGTLSAESAQKTKTSQPDVVGVPKRSASWDVAEALANETGVTDFFGTEPVDEMAV